MNTIIKFALLFIVTQLVLAKNSYSQETGLSGDTPLAFEFTSPEEDKIQLPIIITQQVSSVITYPPTVIIAEEVARRELITRSGIETFSRLRNQECDCTIYPYKPRSCAKYCGAAQCSNLSNKALIERLNVALVSDAISIRTNSVLREVDENAKFSPSLLEILDPKLSSTVNEICSAPEFWRPISQTYILYGPGEIILEDDQGD